MALSKLNAQARISEVGDIARRLVALYDKKTTLHEDEFLKKCFEELEKHSDDLTEALGKDTTLSDLEKFDKERDEAVRVLGKLLIGYEKIPVTSLQNSGKKLASIFKRYGFKITKVNYSEKSQRIASLLSDLAAPELQSDIPAFTGLREAIQNVRVSQSSFANLRADYEHSISQQKAKSSASALRKPLLELLNKKIVSYLNTMEMVASEQYGSFVSEAQQIINSVNLLVKQRTNRNTDISFTSPEA